jgi:hypothetical protein
MWCNYHCWNGFRTDPWLRITRIGTGIGHVLEMGHAHAILSEDGSEAAGDAQQECHHKDGEMACAFGLF